MTDSARVWRAIAAADRKLEERLKWVGDPEARIQLAAEMTTAALDAFAAPDTDDREANDARGE